LIDRFPREGALAWAAFLIAALLGGCIETPAVSGRHVVLLGQGLEQVRAMELALEGDRAVEDVAAFLGMAPPDGRVCVSAFRSRLALRLHLVRNCPEQWDAAAACFETGKGFAVVIPVCARTDRTLRYLRHEMTHYVIAGRFYDVPPWLDEGLAQLFEMGSACARGREERLEGLRRRLLRSRRPVLERLVAVPPGRRLGRRQYGQALGLVLFILDRFPDAPARIRGYLETCDASHDPSAQFEEWFERSPADLESDWREFVLVPCAPE